MDSDMEKTFRTVAFWAVTAISATFLLAFIIAALWAYVYVRAHPPAPGQEHLGSLTMTYGVLLIIAGALFFGVFLGWGRERREVRELRREITDLQLKIKEFVHGG